MWCYGQDRVRIMVRVGFGKLWVRVINMFGVMVELN